MMRPGYLRFAATTSLLLIIAIVLGYQAVARAQALWTSDVYIELLREHDGTSISLDREEVELAVQKVIVKPNDRIETLLKAHGIYADAEAFGAVYTLNPSHDPTSLTPGSELLLPHVRGSENLRAFFEDGYSVALTLDVELKRRLLTQAAALKRLADDFAALEPQHFAHRDARDEVITDVRRSVDFMGAVSVIIRERSRPLSSEMLWQMSSEAELLASILSDVLTKGRDVTQPDKETIGLIAESAQIRSNNLKGVRGPGEPPQRFLQVNVSVKALNAQDRSEVHGLRVFYSPMALFGKAGSERPFLTVTSPTTKWLPIANYRMWVGKPGDSKPISDVLAVQVREQPKGDSMLVELVVRNKR